jgi:peptidoglycan hydrolase-like protein with peptidoglycan-binding domain
VSAPDFPWPSDHWIGQASDDSRNHSGCYGDPDESHVRTWQQKMKDRGWSLGADGCYGPESENVCRQFQDEKGLDVDGDVGPKTWDATWTARRRRQRLAAPA